jgi:dipeptidyl aminopeptidase/acylaminoacyl peptidase
MFFMLKCTGKLLTCFVLHLLVTVHAEDKGKLTLDEFFDYTEYPTVSMSPTDQQLLIEVLKPSWSTDSYSKSLWLYDIEKDQRKLIYKITGDSMAPRWLPSGAWFAFFTPNDCVENKNRNSSEKLEPIIFDMHLYSIATGNILTIELGTVQPSLITWSDQDDVLYYTSTTSRSEEDRRLYELKWKDVVEYRQTQSVTTIYRVDINIDDLSPVAMTSIVANVTFPIGELLYVPFEKQLVFTSTSTVYENVHDFEIYSIHLVNPTSSLIRLTYTEGVEQEIKLSSDGKHVLFRLWALSTGKVIVTQRRIFSLNLITRRVERLGSSFNGLITEYQTKPNGGVYIVGQLGLNIQIYTQESSTDDAIQRYGWNGSYETFTSSKKDRNGPIAFVFSAFQRPKEVYLAENIDRLSSAKALTNFNELFTRRALPESKIYRWINKDDGEMIEGLLHYPPGTYGTSNLPLLVRIHGGPYDACVNGLQANWYDWGLMAATQGWLVFEPNYRGSTGYGDKFIADIRFRLVSLPGQDILMGVDQLIADGIADPKRLNVGGYSFGGFLTNWLITKTTRFNAALSGAGDIEHVSGWGTMDLPLLVSYLHGGFPWLVPGIYQHESPIYNLDKVRTPTLIVTGDKDVRVKSEQSYIFERALHYRGIPAQLLIFPNEGHEFDNNPWHGKIKVREELKWLQKYDIQIPTSGFTRVKYSMTLAITVSLMVTLMKNGVFQV